SAAAALNSLEGAVVLIAGGYDKGLDLAEFADTIAAKASGVVLMKGNGANRLAELIAGRAAVKWADSMKEAVATARLEAESLAAGSKFAKVFVLLSPGFSSYDRYGSYEERGEDFKKLVSENR
ncbi:MAG: UDP-N-acetylmuramoyl-L-alanine--D-glutamate ligase, partial [Deltaproteobacteria bacterium]|nr:UDP-N-acetylmuramoyl-L-alanine--D-glutamate ligase [Deltaproteobacteria bacterium]